MTTTTARVALADKTLAEQVRDGYRASNSAPPPLDQLSLDEVNAAAKDAKQGIWQKMQTIIDAAEGEGRDFHASEKRHYDALEEHLDILADIERSTYIDRSRVVAPGQGRDADTKYVANRPLKRGQTFLAASRAQGALAAEEPDDLSVGAIVAAMISGDWRNANREAPWIRNAMSGAGAGGVLLPTTTSAKVIDLARAKSRVVEAGAQVVPMDARTVIVPRWAGDPALAWRAENAAVAEVDGTMDSVTLAAKTLAAIVRISRELVEDTNVEDVVRDAIVEALAVKWDYAALYGTGTNEPTGVKNTAAVTKTSLGANGATPTWDTLVDAAGRLRDNNEDPTAQIMADRTLRTLSKIKDSAGSYLAPPTYLQGLPRLTTSQVPTNQTVGTSTDTSDVFTGDWRQLYLGIRTAPLTLQLSERFADSGQIGLLVWFRGDIAVARAKALDVVTGARP